MKSFRKACPVKHALFCTPLPVSQRGHARRLPSRLVARPRSSHHLPRNQAHPHHTKRRNHLDRKRRFPEVAHSLLLESREGIDSLPAPEAGGIDVAHTVIVDASQRAPQLNTALDQADEPEHEQHERTQQDWQREQEVDVEQRDDDDDKDERNRSGGDQEVVVPAESAPGAPGRRGA
jgi:hypothetical protein